MNNGPKFERYGLSEKGVKKNAPSIKPAGHMYLQNAGTLSPKAEYKEKRIGTTMTKYTRITYFK